jgi:hypothetical protein
MKVKTQIKLTPLFYSVIQSIMIISAILLKIVFKENWSLSIILITEIVFFYLIGIAIFFADRYYEMPYGILRYRIAKEKILDSDVYFLQAKPLLPLFFLFWKGRPYSHFFYKKDGGDYMCDNAFETKEEADHQLEILKNRNELKKLFLVKKIEICS